MWQVDLDINFTGLAQAFVHSYFNILAVTAQGLDYHVVGSFNKRLSFCDGAARYGDDGAVVLPCYLRDVRPVPLLLADYEGVFVSLFANVIHPFYFSVVIGIANVVQQKDDCIIDKFACRQASIQEGEGYTGKERGYERTKPLKPRIVEIIEFAHKMKYKKLGFVFCMGLRNEAKVMEKVLTENGFEVASVLCKIGREPKETLGIEDHQKIKIGAFEAMCNPIAQAFVMNEEKTQFNILMGLCVGHDSLFLKYSEALCTVFAVKDRLLGHNPLAAIYNIDSYYRSLKFPISE